MARLLTSRWSEKRGRRSSGWKKNEGRQVGKRYKATINMEAALWRGFLDSHFVSLVNPPENSLGRKKRIRLPNWLKMEWVLYNCTTVSSQIFQSPACDPKLRRYVRILGEKLLKFYYLKLTGGGAVLIEVEENAILIYISITNSFAQGAHISWSNSWRLCTSRSRVSFLDFAFADGWDLSENLHLFFGVITFAIAEEVLASSPLLLQKKGSNSGPWLSRLGSSFSAEIIRERKKEKKIW